MITVVKVMPNLNLAVIPTSCHYNTWCTTQEHRKFYLDSVSSSETVLPLELGWPGLDPVKLELESAVMFDLLELELLDLFLPLKIQNLGLELDWNQMEHIQVEG